MADVQDYRVFITSWVAGEGGAICTFNLNTASGALQETQRYTGIENPFFIALSPDRKYLYAVYIPGEFEGGEGRLAAFAVDNAGQLKKLNEQSAKGLTTCYVDVDPTGQAVVCANYGSGSVGAYPVQADGSLGPMASFIEHGDGSLVNAARQEAAHAHCAVISPNGKHVYVCDLGMDKVVGYALDAARATLTPLAQPFVRTLGGGGPRHFTYHPQGNYVYANNELTSSVNVYAYDQATGLLIEHQVISSLPEGFDGQNSTADVKVSPDGRFLYCTNRGHNSIAVYRIGADGCLTLVEIQPSLGTIAQNVAITPDGSLLLCANMVSTDNGKGEGVAVFRIDAVTGRLSPVGEPLSTSPTLVHYGRVNGNSIVIY